MIEIKSVEEYENLLLTGNKFVVDFWAVWCGPCKMIAPKFQALSEKNTEITFVKVNVEDVPEIAQKLSITSVPTIVFYSNGSEVSRVQGIVNENKIQEEIHKL